MKIIFYISLILICLIILDYIIHNYRLNQFNKDLPKDIILSEDISDVILPKVEKTSEINKTIYRTYYDKNYIKNFKSSINKTSESMPDYKQVIYDDQEIEEFIEEIYGERILNAYKSINPEYGPAKADFFRYLILYWYGGIYLDIKTAILKNIEKDISNHKNKLLVSKGRKKETKSYFGLIQTIINKYCWSNFSGILYGEYNNWHIISPKGNEILGNMIKHIVKNIEYGKKNKNLFNNGEYSVLCLTGPILFTKVIEKYKNTNNVELFEKNFNNKVSYRFNINHKNIGKKLHYSKVKNKNILLK